MWVLVFRDNTGKSAPIALELIAQTIHANIPLHDFLRAEVAGYGGRSWDFKNPQLIFIPVEKL